MNNDEMKIVRVTNISDFDFDSELGAMYGGKPYFVAAGKSLLVPYVLGHHLAKHLARAILIKGAPTRDSKELDGKGSDRPLWNEDSILVLTKRILSEVYEEERPAVLSQEEILAKKVEDLNRDTKIKDEDGGNVDASGLEITETINSEVVYKDKAQIIEELKKREIKFNPRLTKKDLQSLLE